MFRRWWRVQYNVRARRPDTKQRTPFRQPHSESISSGAT
jgi:hypothetical protein